MAKKKIHAVPYEWDAGKGEWVRQYNYRRKNPHWREPWVGTLCRLPENGLKGEATCLRCLKWLEPWQIYDAERGFYRDSFDFERGNPWPGTTHQVTFVYTIGETPEKSTLSTTSVPVEPTPEDIANVEQAKVDYHRYLSMRETAWRTAND